jgi:hypothetical protein
MSKTKHCIRIKEPKPKQFYKKFFALLRTLSHEALKCCVHSKFCRDLSDTIDSGKYVDIVNYCNSFWFLTLESHEMMNIINLSKLYDNYPGVLSLPNILGTIKNNRDVFVADDVQLEKDIEFADPDKNSLIKSLLTLRHNIYAHNNVDAATLQPKNDIVTAYSSLNARKIVDLASKALKILNRYNRLYSQPLVLEMMHSYKDVNSLSDKRMDNEYMIEFIFKAINDNILKSSKQQNNNLHLLNRHTVEWHS